MLNATLVGGVAKNGHQLFSKNWWGMISFASSWNAVFQVLSFSTGFQVVINKRNHMKKWLPIMLLTPKWFGYMVLKVQPSYTLNCPDGCWLLLSPIEIGPASFFWRNNPATQPLTFWRKPWGKGSRRCPCGRLQGDSWFPFGALVFLELPLEGIKCI